MAAISQNTESSSTISDHLVNPDNPLFLHLGESPAQVLVTPLLSETNFNLWEHDMIVALKSKNKEHFIYGTLPCPLASNPLREAWRRCNRMVMSWLMRSITPSIRQSVMWMDTASEMWQDIRDCFSHKNKFRIANLLEQIQQCDMEILLFLLTIHDSKLCGKNFNFIDLF
jgi:hypothetical protein